MMAFFFFFFLRSVGLRLDWVGLDWIGSPGFSGIVEGGRGGGEGGRGDRWRG